MAGFAAQILEDYPETILQTEVSLEPGESTIDSTVKEWYDLGVHMLREHGWDGSPNLTQLSVHFHCTPNSQEPVLDNVYMQFADAYFMGVIPSLKFGYVSFQISHESASVEIAYEPLRWRHTTVDMSRIKVDWRQALEIGQQHGGATFLREVGDKCIIGLRLDGYVWHISYGDSGTSPRWIGPTIWLDARTGKVLKIHESP